MSNTRNGSKMTGRLIDQHSNFLREQLMETQQSLFFARSVKEAKFLQSRIDYLKKTLRDSNGRVKR